MNNLYYADTSGVQTVPYTETRAKWCYGTYREALVGWKEMLTNRVNGDICRIMEIEKILAKENQNAHTSKDAT
jgi:hypothetical protein